MSTAIPLGLSEPLGIFQTDLIIRTALLLAIKDLRENPSKLDYVFSSLPKDSQTADQYGTKEVDQAKKWFLNTEISVFMNTRLDDPKFPCLSITLTESAEEENTLADAHYQITEASTSNFPLQGPIAPDSYTISTGTLAFGLDLKVDLAPGMVIVDKKGVSYIIQDVPDLYTAVLLPNSPGNFDQVWIKGAPPTTTVDLESASFKESYQIGCHVSGEPVHLTYLHSIVVFALLHYRQELLESRGFERSRISSTDIRQNPDLGVEVAWSRWVRVNGYVRQYWPKSANANITSTKTVVSIADSGNLPNDTDPDDASWIGDQDALLVGLK